MRPREWLVACAWCKACFTSHPFTSHPFTSHHVHHSDCSRSPLAGLNAGGPQQRFHECELPGEFGWGSRGRSGEG